jgi:hypothetical protein
LSKPRNWRRLQLLAVIATTAFMVGQLTHDLLGQSITIPNTFVNGTTADANQVNANFTALASNALNRNNGTMIGPLNSQNLLPTVDATYDIGSALFRFRDLFTSRNTAIGGTLTVTGATTHTSATLSIGGASYTWPGAVGAAGAYLRASDASGTLGWSTSGWTYVTTTATGTQNNFDPGIVGNTVIRANNASDLTVTGFPAGVNGQQILVQAVGSANVFLAENSGSSSAGNKLANQATSANTPVSARGFALYVYDTSSALWRLAAHEQGAWISAGTPTVAGSGAMTVTSPSVTLHRYRLSGRQLTVQANFTFTLGGVASNVVLYTIPGSFTAVSDQRGAGLVFNSTHVMGGYRIGAGGATSSQVAVFANTDIAGGTNWTLGANEGLEFTTVLEVN